MAPKSKKPTPAATPAAAQPPPPSWPALTPLPHPDDLELTNILEDQILTISNLWPGSLCKKYVTFLSNLPLTTTPNIPKRGHAVRVNDRFQIEDASFAEKLWSETGLEGLVRNATVDGKTLDDNEKERLWGGEVLGLNSNIRIYRYRKGQFFDQHYDESNNITFNNTPAKTTWTLLLYLTAPSTGCIGGETVFYPEPPTKRSATPAPVVTDLEVGLALLHRHGKDCLIHEGREVTDGEKWVIRSDLCVKR